MGPESVTPLDKKGIQLQPTLVILKSKGLS